MTMTEATGSGTGPAQTTTRSSAANGMARNETAVDNSAVNSRVPYTVPQPPATIDSLKTDSATSPKS